MARLALARYRFTFRVTEPLHLPDYAGSALRGAFGQALQQVSGVSNTDRDQKTELFLQSPYARIFVPHDIPRESATFSTIRQVPVQYVIEAPIAPARRYQPGESIAFNMVLMGEALDHLAIIILAWRRAFLRGIGKYDGKAELTEVEHLTGSDAQSIYTDDQPLIREHSIELTIPEFQQARDVHLQLVTPLRLQQEGKVLGAREMSAGIFLRNLIRRVSYQVQIQHPHAYPMEQIRNLNALAGNVADDRRLAWRDWERYSSRQKQAMKLGGVVGRWYFKNVPAELLSFIHLGQWMHVGKETAFGLGKYQWMGEAWLSNSAEPDLKRLDGRL